MRLMVAFAMALIIALIIGIGLEAADATEIEAFRHYTGYQKSRLEVEFDQATTFTMVTRAENTTDTVERGGGDAADDGDDDADGFGLCDAL